MKSVFVNRCRQRRMPRKFLGDWVARLSSEPVFRPHGEKELVMVFVDAKEMQGLNRRYRGKNRPTDVLSFDPIDESFLGELVLCPSVLQEQAIETGLSYRQELGFMVIHGCLHLLGFDHERGGVAAKRMFTLQDRLFQRLSRSLRES